MNHDQLVVVGAHVMVSGQWSVVSELRLRAMDGSRRGYIATSQISHGVMATQQSTISLSISIPGRGRATIIRY